MKVRPFSSDQCITNVKFFYFYGARYTADNSVKHGAPRDTDHPERRQALAFEVWQSVTKAVYPKEKITILTNGPLTNLANILLSDKNATSVIQVREFHQF